MKSGVYKITNEVTGKFYIGSAKDIDWRWIEHKRDLRLKSHCNPKLQHSWDFYGEEKFTLVLLEEVEPDKMKLFEREQYYLDTFKPWMRGVGYNICPTAQGGDNITHHPDRDAFIEKMSGISSGENNPMFGRTHSDKTVEDMKAKAKGRFTLDWFIKKWGEKEGREKYVTRKDMLSNRKISYSYSNPMKGKHRGRMSNDVKRKISENKLRMNQRREEFVQDIQSDRFTVKELSMKYDISQSSVKYTKSKLKKT